MPVDEAAFQAALEDMTRKKAYPEARIIVTVPGAQIDDGGRIARSLLDNTELDALNITGTLSAVEIQAILYALPRSGVTHLGLAGLPLDDAAVDVLVAFIQRDDQLETLVLDQCGINDKQAERIASALESNSALSYLSVNNNAITHFAPFKNLVRTNCGLRFMRGVFQAADFNEAEQAAGVGDEAVCELGIAVQNALEEASRALPQPPAHHAAAAGAAAASTTAVDKAAVADAIASIDAAVDKIAHVDTKSAQGARAKLQAARQQCQAQLEQVAGEKLNAQLGDIQQQKPTFEGTDTPKYYSVKLDNCYEGCGGAIAEVLDGNVSIDNLSLQGELSAQDLDYIFKALDNSKVTSLTLNVPLDAQGAVALAQFIARNETLTNLKLDGCQITDASAQVIAAAFNRNADITWFGIQNNGADFNAKPFRELTKTNCGLQYANDGIFDDYDRDADPEGLKLDVTFEQVFQLGLTLSQVRQDATQFLESQASGEEVDVDRLNDVIEGIDAALEKIDGLDNKSATTARGRMEALKGECEALRPEMSSAARPGR
jgi:hypothetical protein